MGQTELPLGMEFEKGKRGAKILNTNIAYNSGKSSGGDKKTVDGMIKPAGGAFELLNQEIERNDKDRKAQLGREQAKRYQAIKSKVFEMEKTNNSKVIVFSSGPGWYKIGGNSALIYAHMLAPKIGVAPSIKEDRDFYSKFENGTISVRHLDLLTTNLKNIGIEPEQETPEMTIFALDKPLSKQELKAICNIREERVERVNQIVCTKQLYPSVASLMRKITKELYSKYIHCSGNARTYIVEELARGALSSTVDLVQISTGALPAKETLVHIGEKNERTKAYIMILMEMGIFESEEALRLENDLVDVNTQIKAELKKLVKTEKKK